MSVQPRIKLVRKTPTVDTAAYADEDRLGSIMTFTDALGSSGTARQGLLRSVVLIFESGTPAAMNLWLFRSLPTIASADNAAFDITDAQMTANFIGHVQIPVTADVNLVTSASNAATTVQNLNLPIDSTDGHLYGVLEAQGAITFTAADDLTVVLGIQQV